MDLKKIYHYLIQLKRNKGEINIKQDLLPRFAYFLNTPNFYREYNYNEVINNNFENKNQSQRILLINFDYHDFIQSYFFRNEVIKYCNAHQFNVDCLSAFPYKNYQCELDYLMKEPQIKCGQEWLFPVDNNKWKEILKNLLSKNNYSLIIFNGINYYFYYFFSLYPECKGKIVIYDPHLLSGKNDWRDIPEIDNRELKKGGITIIADANSIDYRNMGLSWFKNIISHKYAIPSFLKKFYQPKKEFTNKIFMGGDTRRDYQGLYLLAKDNPNSMFSACTSQILNLSASNLNIYSRQPYFKFLELLNSSDISLIMLENDEKSSGIIVLTLSLMLGKICLINDFKSKHRYIKNGYNGLFFSDHKNLNELIKKITANPNAYARIGANASKTFDEKHTLEKLVENIFKCMSDNP